MSNGYYQNGGNNQAKWLAAQELTVKEKIQYSLLGIAVLGGMFFIGRHIVKKAAEKSEQKKTMEKGSAPTIAKQIKMAFENDGWFGTDKEALRLAIRSVPSKREFSKVMASYQRLYDSSLLKDMQGELKSSEYNEMLAIVSAKPDADTGGTQQLGIEQVQSWAKRLNAAFDISYGPFPGTDEEAVKAVFIEIPTQEVFQSVAIAYQNLFGSSLYEELKSELEYWEYEPVIQIIYSKPKN